MGKLRTGLIVAGVWVTGLMPLATEAAGLAPRNVVVGSSGQGVSTSYAVNATTATAASIGSVGFQICGAPTGACVTPAGVVTTSATLAAQSPGGFSMVNGSNGAPYITRTAAPVGAGTAMSFTLGSITNPSTANLSYFVRITTYTGTDGATGAVDTGTVALSTAQPVQLTGVTPEILVFCVGTSIAGNCTTVSGSTIDFGDFSPTVTRSGTSVMQAQTNAANGYAITVTGTTLASGVNTIPALATQTGSVIGTSQFGLNLRANGTPALGADPSGAGSGTFSGAYGTPDLYRFASGDVVAAGLAPTNANTFTSSYIVNIGGAQAAGVYTATMTYICTASF
ncbi:MAG TPA: hypothetical protein VMT30_00170 [Candidatus Saccharimonadia bacterium]|nr:hypothetical protein [Candidatus Saccharimonadia bacterium]